MARPYRRWFVFALPPVVLSLAVLVIAMSGARISPVYSRTTTLALVTMLAVIGVYMFTGTSGIISFGHMSFMLVGAYASGLLTVPVTMKEVVLPRLPGWLATANVDFLTATLVAGGVGAAMALLVSPSLMRLAGLAASISSFALLVIVQIVASQWTDVTAGYGTFVGVPIETTLGTALTWVVVAIIAAYLFQMSPWGLQLRATREDPVAAAAAGVSVVRMRAAAFVLSGFFVGVAGSLYAHLVGAFSTNAFYIDQTFLVIAMLVVGGLRSLAGAVVGPIVVTVITEILRAFERGTSIGGVQITGPVGMTQVGLALVILIVLLIRPWGLMGDGEHGWLLSLARRTPRVAQDEREARVLDAEGASTGIPPEGRSADLMPPR